MRKLQAQYNTIKAKDKTRRHGRGSRRRRNRRRTFFKQSSDLGRKSEWIDRRASHLAEIDITEELEDGQVSDARIVLTRAVEDVIQHFNHL